MNQQLKYYLGMNKRWAHYLGLFILFVFTPSIAGVGLYYNYSGNYVGLDWKIGELYPGVVYEYSVKSWRNETNYWNETQIYKIESIYNRSPLILKYSISVKNNIGEWCYGCDDPLIYDGNDYAIPFIDEGMLYVAENEYRIDADFKYFGHVLQNLTVSWDCYVENYELQRISYKWDYIDF